MTGQAELQTRHDALAKRAFLDCERAENGEQIAAIWEKVNVVDWRAGVNLSLMIENIAEDGTKWERAFNILCGEDN